MKQIRLSKGLYALVDDVDFEWLSQWSWCASLESRGTKYYAIRFEKKNGKRVKIRMHVEVYKRRTELVSIPHGHVIDHVNHNSLDNRFEIECEDDQNLDPWYEQQLELITQAENMRRSPGWKKKGQKILCKA